MNAVFAGKRAAFIWTIFAHIIVDSSNGNRKLARGVARCYAFIAIECLLAFGLASWNWQAVVGTQRIASIPALVVTSNADLMRTVVNIKLRAGIVRHTVDFGWRPVVNLIAIRHTNTILVVLVELAFDTITCGAFWLRPINCLSYWTN